MKQSIILIFFFVFITYSKGYPQQTITFPSIDGLKITADLYKINDTSTYIVLCHLSDHSRGEYKETAKRLNKFGYNCLAIDTRTGNEIFGVINQTSIEAKKLNRPTGYLNSEQDIIAAVNYADSLSNNKGVIVFGSSFSASLALKIGAVNTKVKSVIAFSPGEYFGKQLKLKKVIAKFNKPVFATSSKDEAREVALLMESIKFKNKVQFIPKEKGEHGSLSLWSSTLNNSEYWEALEKYLQETLLIK